MTDDVAMPTLAHLAWHMFRLGLVSFGGNNALLMSHMVVDRQHWLTQDAMDEAIAMATLAPGGNSSNLSYEVGRRIRGAAGGLIAYASMAIPGIIIVITVGSWILSVNDTHIVRGALAGAESAAVAMVAAIAYRLGRKSLNRPLDWLLAVSMFVTVGALGWSLLLCFPPAAAIEYLVRARGWAR